MLGFIIMFGGLQVYSFRCIHVVLLCNDSVVGRWVRIYNVGLNTFDSQAACSPLAINRQQAIRMSAGQYWCDFYETVRGCLDTKVRNPMH